MFFTSYKPDRNLFIAIGILFIGGAWGLSLIALLCGVLSALYLFIPSTIYLYFAIVERDKNRFVIEKKEDFKSGIVTYLLVDKKTMESKGFGNVTDATCYKHDYEIELQMLKL